MTNIFCWGFYVSLLPTEKLEKHPGIQELMLSGSWGKETGNCSPSELSSGQPEQPYEMLQAKGRDRPLELYQLLEKLMPFPWRPHKAAAAVVPPPALWFLAAYWLRWLLVLPKPKAIPGCTFPVWQTTMGGTGVTKAQCHYRQSWCQTCRCRWVFTGGNVMMEECSYRRCRQQVMEALEILRIYVRYQLFPYILFCL